jgi:hypothetical protein
VIQDVVIVMQKRQLRILSGMKITEEARNKKRKKNKEWKLATKRFIHEIKKTKSCVDCGETDPAVLQFDHVRGEKKFKLSEAHRVGAGKKRILEEIEKCEVRCVNCHTSRTAKEQNWWILEWKDYLT